MMILLDEGGFLKEGCPYFFALKNTPGCHGIIKKSIYRSGWKKLVQRFKHALGSSVAKNGFRDQRPEMGQGFRPQRLLDLDETRFSVKILLHPRQGKRKA